MDNDDNKKDNDRWIDRSLYHYNVQEVIIYTLEYLNRIALNYLIYSREYNNRAKIIILL